MVSVFWRTPYMLQFIRATLYSVYRVHTSVCISVEDGDFNLGAVHTDVRSRRNDLVARVQLYPQLLKHA